MKAVATLVFLGTKTIEWTDKNTGEVRSFTTSHFCDKANGSCDDIDAMSLGVPDKLKSQFHGLKQFDQVQCVFELTNTGKKYLLEVKKVS
jgi:hypothetical protein